MYFDNNLTTKAEIDARYKQLCKKLHPDVGGRKEDFVAMSDEYRRALLRIQDDARKKNDTDTLKQCADTLRELNNLVGIWLPEISVKIQAAVQHPIATALGALSPEIGSILDALSGGKKTN